uniref:ULP_PROTEASE domain-containing protein n=1 Tax=Heligmosomoides polygyrus TaxID=6339 RepID=A0A183G8R2_HELPZ
LIVIDSLFNSTAYVNLTRNVAVTAYRSIGLALRATLHLMNDEFDLGKYTLIRMERMPCQTNGYDCGFYMTLFAEHFTKHDSWKLSKDSGVLNRNALNEQGFGDRCSFDGMECVLQVDECNAQRQLVLSRHFDVHVSVAPL